MAIVKIVPPKEETKKVVKCCATDSERSLITASYLVSAFGFAETQEGEGFWDSVAARLRQIAADGILKE